MAIPTSSIWNLADFNSATIGSLLTLGPGDITIVPSTSPYFTYTPDFLTLIGRSDDGAAASFKLDVAIPARFTVEFVARFPFMPHNTGDLANRRAGFTVADDAGRGVSIYFASTGLAVSRVDDFGSVTALPDTTEVTAEIETEFKTIRVAVDSGLGRAYVYIGDGDTTNPLFQYIVPVEATPDTVVDTFQFFVKGFADQPSQVELRRIQLAGDLVIPNFPPIADAGPDRVAPVGQAVRFDGRSSFDVEGAPLTYDWRLTDAPTGSQFAHEQSAGNTTDDGDADGFTDTLSFPSGALPAWVAAGDTLRISSLLHEIATVDNPGGSLTVTTDTIPDDLSDTPFRVYRQSILIGPETETPRIIPDIQGIYRFQLVVNDGEIDSEPSEVLASIVGAQTPFGLEPDLSFLWKALGDEWKFIEGREVFEEAWRGVAQILGGKLLEAWQHHYNFSIRDAQRVFQQKWVAFRTLIAETDHESTTIELRFGALRATHEFEGGDPTVTGLTLVFEHPTGVTPSSVDTITVTLTGDSLATIIADCNAALVDTGIEAYSFAHNRDSTSYRYDATDGITYDDGDGNRVTDTFEFTPGSLPAFVSPGDTLLVGNRRFEIATVDNPSGLVTLTEETIDDDLGSSAQIQGTAVLTAASFPPIVGKDFNFSVDGVPYSVTFTAGVINTTALIGEINAAVGVTVASIDSLNRLVLTSTIKGAPSTLSIDAGTASAVEAQLGMPVGTASIGTSVPFRIWRHSRLGFKSTTTGFRILSSSTAAAVLGLPTDQYNYLDGVNGARVTDLTYFAGDGVSLSEFGVTRGDLLVLNNGQSFQVDKVISGSQDPLDGQRFLLTDTLPFDATPEWELPSIIRSTEVNYEFEGSYPGDLIKVEAFDETTEDVFDLTGTVVAQKNETVVGRLDGLYGVFFAIGNYELRLLGVKRRKALSLPDEVVSIPQLQDLIPQAASPTLWKENIDYVLEPFYRELNEDPIPMLQFDDSVFIGPDIEPPDIFWAELVLFSNEPNVENTFGRLASFLRDDASLFERDFDYVSGVAGLLYAHQRGPRVHAMRVGAQILLGQPFAEVDGIITEIRTDFSPTKGRFLIQDDDGNDPSESSIFRTYVYLKDPLDLSGTSGIDINPATGVPWAEGDEIAQFSPIGAGVRIVDIYNDPSVFIPFLRGGLITEVEKFHSFLVEFNLDLVSLANLSLLFQFITKVKPTYTHPFLVGLKDVEDDIDVTDELDKHGILSLIDIPCGWDTTGPYPPVTAGPAWMYDDYRSGVYTGGLPPTPIFTPDDPFWTSYDDGVAYYDASVDCPLDLIEFCMTMSHLDSKATFTGGEDISLATYPGDFGGRTLELIIDGTTHSIVFSGGIADETAVVAEINAAVGAVVASLSANDELIITSDGAAGTQDYLGVTDGSSAGGGTLTFTPASLPAWVGPGDELFFEGVLVHILTVNNPGGSLTVTPPVLPAASSKTFRIWEPFTSVEIGALTTPALLPVIGFYVGQKAEGNAVDWDTVFGLDTSVTDLSGVVGDVVGSVFTPTYDMNLPAGSYQVCLAIKSRGVVLP